MSVAYSLKPAFPLRYTGVYCFVALGAVSLLRGYSAFRRKPTRTQLLLLYAAVSATVGTGEGALELIQ